MCFLKSHVELLILQNVNPAWLPKVFSPPAFIVHSLYMSYYACFHIGISSPAELSDPFFLLSKMLDMY